VPAALRRLFWDLDSGRLAWDRDCDLIVGRVLASGGWKEARLLRRRLGDQPLREWVIRHEARGLSPARVRFWELVLDLPKAKADAWVRAARVTIWEGRHPR
jgi:hypothetical protein